MEEFIIAAVTADQIQQVKYMERLLQLSTDVISQIYLNRDDVPPEVMRAADNWYAFLSEVTL